MNNKWTVLGIFLMIVAAGAMALSIVLAGGAQGNFTKCISTYQEYAKTMDELVAAKDRQIAAQQKQIDAQQKLIDALDARRRLQP